MSRTQVPATAACHPGQRSRVEQPSRKWRTKIILQYQMAVVSCQLQGCSRAEPKSRKLGIPSNISVWSPNEGLRRADGTRFCSNVGDQGDELASRFIFGYQRKRSWKDMSPRKRSEESISGVRGFDETSHSELRV